MFLNNYQFLHHHIHHNNWTDIVGVLANIITILGIIGLVLAYIEYRNKLKEDKKSKIREILNIIASTKFQLETIGHWTNYKDGGYKDENLEKWIQENYKERAQPFHKIHQLDYSYIKNISALPGIGLLDESINESFAWMLQWCASFNGFLGEIESFKYSRSSEKNIILSQKAKISKSNQEFIKSLNDEEVFFTDNLMNMYMTLHFKIIADEKKQCLHFWHKKLIDLLNQLEELKKKELENLN